MSEASVVIIGAGPAGLAAAGELARTGIRSVLIEQRPMPGGAIHRQPVGGAKPVPISAIASRRFENLMRGIAVPLVQFRASTTFLGLDGDGFVLVEDRALGRVESIVASAVIFATGAVEKVRPLPGWELPGVSTAGGLQVMLKETGTAPQGRVLLAGTGPLLIALAAQMIRAGKPPVAIIESGNPLVRPGAALRLLGHWALLSEAASFTLDVLRSGTAWKRAAHVVKIERHKTALVATVRHSGGCEERIEADRIALHDGICENDIGLPREERFSSPIIAKAGDCRQALGVLAAVADGERAAAEVAMLLSGRKAPLAGFDKRITKQVEAQALIARLFAPVASPPSQAALPDDTVICRCEGGTVGDMKALLAIKDGLSGREVKHNGRFAMGSCQGRFCAANAAALMGELRPDAPVPSLGDLTGRRWPIRPVSIAAFVNAASDEKTNHEVQS